MTIEYPLAVPFTPAVEEFFNKNKIFLKHPYKVSGRYRRGEMLTLPTQIRVERFSTMPPKQFVQTGSFSYCMSDGLRGSTIGRYCSIAKNVRVMGHAHPTDWLTSNVIGYRPYAARFVQETFGKTMNHPRFRARPRPVRIEHDVWIGQDVLLRDGITIGVGAIIAAGSVVTKDVQPYDIVGGAPARRIRRRFDDATVARLLASEWWRYNLADLADLSVADVPAFLDGLAERVASGAVTPFEPGWVDLGRALAKRIPPVAAPEAAPTAS